MFKQRPLPGSNAITQVGDLAARIKTQFTASAQHLVSDDQAKALRFFEESGFANGNAPIADQNAARTYVDEALLSAAAPKGMMYRVESSGARAVPVPNTYNPAAEAVAILVGAYRTNIGAYASAMFEPSAAPKSVSATGGHVFHMESSYAEAMGSVDGQMMYRNEGATFGTGNLNKFMGMSIELAMATALQRPGLEMMFPTVMLDPECGGTTVEIPVPYIWNGYNNTSNGKGPEIQRWPLLQLVRQSDKLIEDRLTLTSQPAPDGSNEAFFVDKTILPHHSVSRSGQTLLTNLLALGKAGNLISLGKAGTQAASGANDTDRLDRVISISRVGFKVGDQVIVIDTRGLSGALATPSGVSGSDKIQSFVTPFNVHLNGDVKPMIVQNQVLMPTTVTDPLLQRIASENLNVILRARVVTEVELDTAKYSPIIMDFEVVQIDSHSSIDGTIVSLPESDPLFAQLKSAIVPLGPEIRSTLTNTNLREIGLLSGTDVQHDFYGVSLGSPLGHKSPVGQGKDVSEDPTVLQGLINISQMRSNALAVERLKAEVALAGSRRDVNQVGNDSRRSAIGVEGVAARLVKKFFRHSALKVSDLLAASSNMEVRSNLSAALLNVFRADVQTAVVESEFLIAAAYLTGNQNPDWQVLVLTGHELKSYIMESGDSRTFGPDVNYRIESDPDRWFENKILITIAPVGGKPMDPLSPGWRLKHPEVVASVATVDGTANFNKTLIIPRERHVWNSQILMVYEIDDIGELLKARPFIQVDARMTDVTPTP